jgi:hypothetical protein
MTDRLKDEISTAARAVERIVNEHEAAGGSRAGVALTMMAAAADLLTLQWGAPRTLAVFDELVEKAAGRDGEATAH